MSNNEYKEKDVYDLPFSCERNTILSTNEYELILVPSDMHNLEKNSSSNWQVDLLPLHAPAWSLLMCILANSVFDRGK